TRENQVAVLAPVSPGADGGQSRLPAEPVRTLSFEGGPIALIITYDGALGFVTERDAGRLAMLDVPANTVLTSIHIGGSPQAVVTGAYPPALDVQSVNTVAIAMSVGALAVIIGVGIVMLRRKHGGGPVATAVKETHLD